MSIIGMILSVIVLADMLESIIDLFFSIFALLQGIIRIALIGVTVLIIMAVL